MVQSSLWRYIKIIALLVMFLGFPFLSKASQVVDIGQGSNPITAVISGNNLYTIDEGTSVVSVIDTTTNKLIDTIPGIIGGGDAKLIGSMLYIANTGSLQSQVTGTTVSVIDTNPNSPKYNTVVKTITTGGDPISFAQVGDLLYVADNHSAELSIIDINPTDITYNNVVGTVSVSVIPWSETLVGTRLYVTSHSSNNPAVDVVDVDPSSQTYNTVIATITAGMNAGPEEARLIGTKLYICNQNAGTVSVVDVDPTSQTYNTVVATITVQAFPYSSSLVGNRLYVNNFYSNTVSVVDVDPTSQTYNTVVATIQVGSGPYEGTVVLGNRLYVGAALGEAVAVIDLDNTSPTYNQVINTIPVDGAPVNMVLVGGRYLYTINYGGSIAVVDTKTNTLVPVPPPVLVQAVANGNTVTLSYDEVLDQYNDPAATDFNIKVNGIRVGIMAVSESQKNIILTTHAIIAPGDTVTVDYTAGTNPIVDAVSEKAADLSGQLVTNQSASIAQTVIGKTSSAVVYGCKDPQALNYNSFSFADNTLCKYSTAQQAVSLNNKEIVSTPNNQYHFTRILKYGMSGSDVIVLQNLLKIVPSSKKFFGAKTRIAVIEYQKSHGLKADGVVGLQTEKLLEGV